MSTEIQIEETWADVQHNDKMREIATTLAAYDIPAKYATGIRGMDAKSNLEARAALKQWILGDGKPWLYLYGEVGTGKTALLYAALIALVTDHDTKPYRTTMSDLIETYSNTNYGEKELFVDRLRKVKFLIIDEWGVEVMGRDSETDKSTNVIYRILDYRYERDRRVLGAGNLDLAVMAKRSDTWARIVSRFTESGCAVELNDYNFRTRP